MEKVAKEYVDDFELIKINIDENNEIASQLRIQSIPTVYAFKDKKIINAFQGVISEKDFIDFIEKASGKKLKEDITEFCNDIKKLIAEKNFDEAKNKLLTFFSEKKAEPIIVSLYLECLLALRQFDEIDDFVSSLDEETRSNKEIEKITKKINIVKDSKNSESIDVLINKFNENPTNTDILLEICEAYFSDEEYEKAFSLLLDNYYKNKDIVKKKLLEFFEALGNDHDATKTYRKKLSSLIVQVNENSYFSLLNGAIMFPNTNLPLNIFEERYIDMVDYSLSNNKIIGMIQHKANNELYDVGCYGKITAFNETPDKRYIINLEGKNCFKIIREINSDYKFRLCEIEVFEDYNNNKLSDKLKIELINFYKKYNEIKNINLSFDEISQLNIFDLLKLIVMVSPFDTNIKQLCLEIKSNTELYESVLSALKIELASSQQNISIN